MEYTINKLSKLAGISTRTLRYYDEISLLKPHRINSSGYRIYGQNEVDKLQQILFLRELGVSLEEIKQILSSDNFDICETLENHLDALMCKQNQITILIENVKKTILSKKGELTMTDNEKFEGFKKKMIDDNEAKYGDEIRQKYGDEEIDSSNKKIKGMTKEQYETAIRLSNEIDECLKAAIKTGDPASELAQKTCELHKEWLCIYYDKYSKEYHRALADMYVADERFKAYYDAIVDGGAEFLSKAILIYCK